MPSTPLAGTSWTAFANKNPGGTYSLQGTAADYDVGGPTGTIALTTAGATRAAVLLSGGWQM